MKAKYLILFFLLAYDFALAGAKYTLPVEIEVTKCKRSHFLTNNKDTAEIEKKYNNYVFQEMEEILAFEKISDTLSWEAAELLNEQLQKKLIKKQISFIQNNASDYFSFRLFKNYIVPSIFSSADVNLSLFENIFPETFTTTIEGKQVLRMIIGRRLAEREGDFYPPFKTRSFEGKEIDSDRFKGKYLLINIWASWCIPCVAELPTLRQIFDRYDSSQFQIISISIDQDSIKYKGALEKYKIKWINVLGDQELLKQFGGAVIIPQLFLFSKEGKLIYNRNYRNDTSKELPFLKRILSENLY